MNEGDALVYAYLLDGNGGGAALDGNAIDNWYPSQGLLWIHLDSKIHETQVTFRLPARTLLFPVKERSLRKKKPIIASKDHMYISTGLFNCLQR